MEFKWKGFSREEILNWTSIREYELKCGEEIDFLSHDASFEKHLSNSNAKFVIIGIEESLGPQANLGKSGAENGFKSFLKAFLNVQSNRFLDLKNITLAGYLNAHHQENKTADKLRDEVAIIDYQVLQKVSCIFKHGKTPIVIGGGHNNAYPIIKAWFEAKKSKINILNLDPHADFRALEGRHSGNSFSYAYEENMLDKYAVFGLQESYNSENMLQEMESKNGVSWISQEKILQEPNPLNLFSRYIEQFKRRPTGLEIDMDSIAYLPVSAYSPSGFSLEEARRYLIHATKHLSVSYLHLPEAAPRNEREETITGKSLTYLVTDFIKNKV